MVMGADLPTRAGGSAGIRSIRRCPAAGQRLALAAGSRLSFTGTSRDDCFAQYRLAIAKRPDGQLVTSSRATVGEWLDQWLEDHVRPNTADSPRTQETYESVARLRLKPMLGRVQLGKL
jgi:hypothetical protein